MEEFIKNLGDLLAELKAVNNQQKEIAKKLKKLKK